jgi:hypothetical protein
MLPSDDIDNGPALAAPPLPATPASAPAAPAMSERLGSPAGMIPVPGTPLPAVPTVAADVIHHSMLGRAVSTLMGTTPTYSVDPNTGATVATPTKPQPGDIWRHIVAGAILGGAAGASAPAGTTPLQRTFLGAQASVTQNKIEDQQNFNRTQESAKTQLETKRVNQELLYQQAQIAHMHKEDLRADAQFDLMNPVHIDSTNNYNTTLENGIKEAGASSVPIVVDGQNINGKMDNGAAFSAAYTKDPSIGEDPRDANGNPTAHRVHVQHVDTNGLHYELGKGWVDEKGQNVDMSTRTTHSFYDIPVDTFKQKVPVTHKELNSLAGFKAFPNDDDTAQVSVGDLINMKGTATKNALEESKAKAEITREANSARMLSAELGRIASADRKTTLAEDQALFQNLQITNERLVNHRKELISSGDPSDAAMAKALDPILTENERQMQAFTNKGQKTTTTSQDSSTSTTDTQPVAPKAPAADTISELKKDNVRPSNFSELMNISQAQGLQNPSVDEQAALAKAFNLPVPFSAIENMVDMVNKDADTQNAALAKSGQKPRYGHTNAADMTRRLESNGLTVAPEPEMPELAGP